MAINRIIGDTSFEQTFAYQPTPDTPDTLRIKTHLQFVKNQLLERNCADLDASSLKRRKTSLKILQTYIDRGVFPINDLPFPEAQEISRLPIFIDSKGTHCAVGYLIKEDGLPQLAKQIDLTFHKSYVLDMEVQKVPGFQEWIQNCGFTAQELATIQPTYDFLDPVHDIEPYPLQDVITCPGAHGLTLFIAPNDNFTCDRCRISQQTGATLHGCRICDYDACDLCYAGGGYNPFRPLPVPPPPPQDPWHCPICTFENVAPDSKCKMCGSEKPEPEIPDPFPLPEPFPCPEPEPGSVWTCDLCTFENVGTKICQHCKFGKKPDENSGEPGEVSMWICDLCGGSNEYKFFVCKKCQCGKQPPQVEGEPPKKPKPKPDEDGKQSEDELIDVWLAEGISSGELNKYGDPTETGYLGGSPLFDERTGTSIDVKMYIKKRGYYHKSKPWIS